MAPTREPIHPHFPNCPVKPSYRIREVARYTGFSRWSIEQAIDAQQLSAFKIGKRTYRIPLESLRQYLASCVHDPFL